MSTDGEKKERKSLKDRMSCDKHDCGNGLHCFRVTQRKNVEVKPTGACQFCGTEGLVKWKLVWRRDPAKIEETIRELKKEGIRHQYWCEVELDPKAVIHARKKGRLEMREAAVKRILQSVAKAQNYNEGHQTPWIGKPPRAVYYAQHATGTCCRRCIEYWHGIEPGRDLTEDEVKYLASLLTRYIEEKVDLTPEGETINEIQEHSPELFPEERG